METGKEYDDPEKKLHQAQAAIRGTQRIEPPLGERGLVGRPVPGTIGGHSWKFSQERTELYSALADIDVMTVAKEAEVDFIGSKGRVHFKYADLDAILPVLKDACRKVGLAVIQFITRPGDGSCEVITHVGHKSGQYLEVALRLPCEKNDPKDFAGLATYLKRYQLSAVFGISTEEDTDGENLGATYSGSPDDKRWLVKTVQSLPYKLDTDQMRAVSEEMQKSGTTMSVDAATKVIEGIL